MKYTPLPSGLWTAALGLLVLVSVRDAIAVGLHVVDPIAALLWIRLVDTAYFVFYAAAITVFLQARSAPLILTITTLALHAAVLIAIALADEHSSYLRSIRETILPLGFLFAGWIVGAESSPTLLRPRSLLTWLGALLAVSVLTGLVQRLTILQMDDYWFTRYLAANHEVFDEFNYIRDDSARATGLGFSPFVLGYLGLGFAVLAFTLNSLTAKSSRDRFAPAFMAFLAMCALACFLAGTRLALASLLALPLLKYLSPRQVGILIPIAIGSALLFLLYGNVEEAGDASTWGRVEQWSTTIAETNTIAALGAGFATGPGGLWFDSFLLNFCLTFGVVAAALYFCLLTACVMIGRKNPITFGLAMVIGFQYLLQSLEYTIFMSAALLSLGLISGAARRRAFTARPRALRRWRRRIQTNAGPKPANTVDLTLSTKPEPRSS